MVNPDSAAFGPLFIFSVTAYFFQTGFKFTVWKAQMLPTYALGHMPYAIWAHPSTLTLLSVQLLQHCVISQEPTWLWVFLPESSFSSDYTQLGWKKDFKGQSRLSGVQRDTQCPSAKGRALTLGHVFPVASFIPSWPRGRRWVSPGLGVSGHRRWQPVGYLTSRAPVASFCEATFLRKLSSEVW